MIFVEGFRLFLVIAGAIGGYWLGNSNHGVASPVLGLTLGAFVAYVIGGIVGRLLDRGIQEAIGALRRMPAGEIFAAAVLGTAFLLVGLVPGLPLIALVHSSIDYPIVAAFAWVLAAFGVRLGVTKGRDLVRAAGLTRLLGPDDPPPAAALLVDTSAVLDRYLLVLGRAGLLGTGLVLPRVVVDEVRTLAEGPDPVSSRRAHRGLEAVDALRGAGVDVRIDVDELPELDSIDDKVLTLAQRQSLRIVTCSPELARRATEQGTEVLELRHLAAELTPDHPPGERVVLDLVREGRQARQAIGYLPEGDMVVVNDASHLIGAHDVEVVVTSTCQTTQGLLVFAHLADHELHFDFEGRPQATPRGGDADAPHAPHPEGSRRAEGTRQAEGVRPAR